MDIEKYLKRYNYVYNRKKGEKKLRTKSEAKNQNNKTSVFFWKQTLMGNLRFH